MHGVTGWMGTTRHLARSAASIRARGGSASAGGSRVRLDPIPVGRDAARVRRLARENGIERWTTDLDEAIEPGEHVYREESVATNLGAALAVGRPADTRGIWERDGARQAPPAGLAEDRDVARRGFFGRVPSVRIDFRLPGARGRAAAGAAPVPGRPDGGGIVLDTVRHRSHVPDDSSGEVRYFPFLGATRIPG